MRVKMGGSYKRESGWGALMEEEKDLYLERKNKKYIYKERIKK
jgi:hypothetical protein